MIVVDLGRPRPKSTTIMDWPKSGRPKAGLAGGPEAGRAISLPSREPRPGREPRPSREPRPARKRFGWRCPR